MVCAIAYCNASYWVFERYAMNFQANVYDRSIEDGIYTRAEVRRLLDIDSKTVTSRMTNCPNCGAPIMSWKCEYCETVFDTSKAPKAKSELIEAKTRSLANAEEIKILYENALLAMRRYK